MKNTNLIIEIDKIGLGAKGDYEKQWSLLFGGQHSYMLTTQTFASTENAQSRTKKVELKVLVGQIVIFSVSIVEMIAGVSSKRDVWVKVIPRINETDLKKNLNLFQVAICDFLDMEPHGEEFKYFSGLVLVHLG